MTIIIFVSSLVFILSNMFFINVTTASENKTEWQVTLNISESNGASDTVIFGEKDGASDGQDQYDIPKPPSPQEPYIRSWFTTSLDPPYDTLKIYKSVYHRDKWEEYDQDFKHKYYLTAIKNALNKLHTAIEMAKKSK